MATYEFHPFADVWRLFTEDEFAKLKADIQAHGMRLPIILYAGKVLDGRNRYRACRELDIPARYETAKAKTDAEALALVVSLNEHRRHLTTEERSFIAGRLATMKSGVKKVAPPIGGPAGISVPDAAKFMKVSLHAAENAKAVLNHAPELEAEVKAGRKSLSAAADEARRKAASKSQPKSTKDANGLTFKQRVLAAREERARNHKHLTREEVDPNFTGTGREFVEKYGHVQMETAAERANRNARLEEINFLGGVAKIAEGAQLVIQLSHVGRSRLLRRLNTTKQNDRFRTRMNLFRDAMRILEILDLGDAADACPSETATAPSRAPLSVTSNNPKKGVTVITAAPSRPQGKS